jgi:hypothetical protein
MSWSEVLQFGVAHELVRDHVSTGLARAVGAPGSLERQLAGSGKQPERKGSVSE